MGPPPPSVCEWTSHSPCPWWPPPDFASCHFRALCLWYRPLLCPCGCRRPLGQGVGWAHCASLSTPLCHQSRSVENAHLTSSLKCPSAFAKTEAPWGSGFLKSAPATFGGLHMAPATLLSAPGTGPSCSSRLRPRQGLCSLSLHVPLVLGTSENQASFNPWLSVDQGIVYLLFALPAP